MSPVTCAASASASASALANEPIVVVSDGYFQRLDPRVLETGVDYLVTDALGNGWDLDRVPRDECMRSLTTEGNYELAFARHLLRYFSVDTHDAPGHIKVCC